jgi:hypothetical protein
MDLPHFRTPVVEILLDPNVSRSKIARIQAIVKSQCDDRETQCSQSERAYLTWKCVEKKDQKRRDISDKRNVNMRQEERCA